MHLISHRRNTIAELKATSTQYGVEVDIRTYDEQLIIHHDAFIRGEDFENWLSHYQHGTLILNVKEEGLEKRLIELMKKYQIENFFFLDQTFPFLIKTANAGESRCAVRVSEFESIETALSLAGKVQWVWLDTFTKFPLTAQQIDQLHQVGFKICLVSGELQGRNAEEDISKMAAFLKNNKIKVDAVCTKKPEIWESYFAVDVLAV